MSGYGEVAERAVGLIRERGMSARDAWEAAAEKVFPGSESSQKKVCPRSTFLGLAASGRIDGVPGGNYGKAGSLDNAKYAVTAADMVLNDFRAASLDPEKLWVKVLSAVGKDRDKKYNYQMDVVLALHRRGLLR